MLVNIDMIELIEVVVLVEVASCVSPSVNGFFRPMTSGYVTQNWGGYGGHLGID